MTLSTFTKEELTEGHYPNVKNECKVRRPLDYAKTQNIKSSIQLEFKFLNLILFEYLILDAIVARFEIRDERRLNSLWYSIRSELNRKITMKFKAKRIDEAKKEQESKENIPVIELD